MSEHDEPTPRWFRALNGTLAPVARRVRLDADGLCERAAARTGLDDFGDPAVREPLGVLVDALEREAALHPVGRVQARLQLLELLTTRLRLTELLRRRPEIRARPVEAPIVVVGLPRTGTTHLQRLLAADPGLRWLPYWEALAPLPVGDLEHPPPRDADPRVRRAERSLRVLHAVAPRMLAMHEMAARAPDEEIWLLAVDLATMLFEASYHVPSFRDWYDAADLTGGYEHLRTLLQVLQWYHPGERWLLKSPQHLASLGPLLTVFPDAVVVQTHRDPVTVTASMASMATYGRRMNSEVRDPTVIGRYWAARVEHLLRRSVTDRADPGVGPATFVDVHFDDVVTDPWSVVGRLYDAAGRDLSAAGERAMRHHLAASPRHRHGRHRYALADFGLDVGERRRALDFYTERFGVATEA